MAYFKCSQYVFRNSPSQLKRLFLDILRRSLKDSGVSAQVHTLSVYSLWNAAKRSAWVLCGCAGLTAWENWTACGACVRGWPYLRLKTAALLLIKVTLQILPSKNLLPVIFCSSE